MRLRYYIATAMYCAVIFAASQSSNPLPRALPFHQADKVIHVGLFAGLCGLVSLGVRRSGKPVLPVVKVFAPVVFTFCYAVTDEIHQLYVPNRTFDYFDLLSDTAGAVGMQMALMCYWWVAARRLKGRAQAAP